MKKLLLILLCLPLMFSCGDKNKTNKDKEKGSLSRVITNEMREDGYTGKGTATVPNGDKYVGEFKDGKFHGQGTMMWSSEKKYVGQWKEGKKNGFGREVVFESEYAGEWRDDQKWIPLSEVDKNIPTNKKVENRFALVIGNEDYSTYQTSLSSEQNVDYAVNDAIIFKEYALKTFGVKAENMFSLTNATSGKMSQKLNQVIKLVELEGEDAELIIYYAGHGFSDVQKVPHLIPVDVSGSDLSRAINLQEFYQKVGNLKAKKVTVFLDACFTGGGRESGLMRSRGVKVKPKKGSLSGNLLVFSASSGDQSALPYHQQGHGMFTYHLLKKLQESKGKVSMGELADYITNEVSIQSININEKKQDPTVNTSSKVQDSWRGWEF